MLESDLKRAALKQFQEKCGAVGLGVFAGAFRPELRQKQKDRAVRRFSEMANRPVTKFLFFTKRLA
ncbi:hypothetical protein [Mesorhizobium sp. M2E.F.Ca.ET.219.01.1.1]|uniref:hypothetical protein n=1 Tax=Mesorhizobium sp. M2E.F.Ca.ET.219.01.1.1 TaxID=2500530 RepID=UPI000FE13202|nr:hypothetical protein [Mesorhizobium sp. M2E.F.Ca.ET.219.01.1.1]TGQ06777.1 hypothetical protein EN862_027345 [Mesorhizobium sp. M2E.F.Ca.ET.219.01.1.1]